MKILQVINSLATGGAEKLLLETLPLFRKKGIEMDILVLNGTVYPFMKQLKLLNCCVIYSLGTASVYNPIQIFKIIPYLKNYDIIHVHLFPAQYWVVLAKIVSFSKVKLIFTEHSTSNRRMGNRLFQLLDRFIYSQYFTVICITSVVKNIFKNHTGAKNNKFKVIENGVNIEAIKNSESYSKNRIDSIVSQDDTVLIQVSSFQEPKDQATLVRALGYLPNTFKLLLVGDGILRVDCEKLVEELQLQKRVLFLGLRMDVPQLLKTADIVVLSSKYEGLSLSSIEGMASGKPFVASDVPGLCNVVNGAGLLFPQGDERALAKHILNLLNDLALYNKVANACIERAEKYDISFMVDKHIYLYNSLVSNEA